jgi:uncharacterized protein
VTNFGAFVDVGVHQDGLVHISALSDKFVKDPHEIVKAGQIVKVKVLEVDQERKRIALTMRLDDEPGSEKQSRPSQANRSSSSNQGKKAGASERQPDSAPQGAMAGALAQAMKQRKP